MLRLILLMKLLISRLLVSLVKEGGLPGLRLVSFTLVVFFSLQNFVLNDFFVHVCVLFVAARAKLEFLRRIVVTGQLRIGVLGTSLKINLATIGLLEKVGNRHILTLLVVYN